MKRSILAFFCIALFSSAALSRAQVVPSATGNQIHIDVGAMASAYQPDYAGTGIAYESPNRLYGVGAYVDAHITRWVQLEAEGRWMPFNDQVEPGVENGENTYLIGPRIPIVTFHKLTPYGKFLVGMGNGTFLSGNTFVMAYGGGVDYRLTRRFTLRCFDLEYQRWSVTPTLHPYGGSVGLSYRVF